LVEWKWFLGLAAVASIIGVVALVYRPLWLRIDPRIPVAAKFVACFDRSGSPSQEDPRDPYGHDWRFRRIHSFGAPGDVEYAYSNRPHGLAGGYDAYSVGPDGIDQHGAGPFGLPGAGLDGDDVEVGDPRAVLPRSPDLWLVQLCNWGGLLLLGGTCALAIAWRVASRLTKRASRGGEVLAVAGMVVGLAGLLSLLRLLPLVLTGQQPILAPQVQGTFALLGREAALAGTLLVVSLAFVYVARRGAGSGSADQP